MIQKARSAYNALKDIARAKWQLRRCASVGNLTRVFGRVIIEGAGKIIIGERCRLRGTQIPVELVAMRGAELRIGDRTTINVGSSICAQQSIIIGNDCGIGNLCIIADTDFHVAGDFHQIPDASPIRIEDNAWLASRVTILKGVTIGKGAVVSAGSVVVTDVPAYTMVGGNPARIVKRLPQPGDDSVSKPASARASNESSVTVANAGVANVTS